ncbi:serine/threonine protein kinase [Arthrobacter sp. zg-Y809]|uniref:non-specific serine/threonine protein kinase n=1 Tax=Arthrobacter gengyunqii TaxID=2886940 RepID=A0A9X1S6W4_9MICC|nr:serine/threonine-protein kinase [Arthrobacter gengyunqii]MCC3270253.1 serine/threonine protein kinase [Arthrobacter gengyunqii]MCC3271036.1 serine/threonine protein kinase [Arthrobacter gengyunqii]
MDSFAADGPNRLISGRYRLIEPIGHGGMATVYRGQDEALGRDIAVKLFRASAVAPDDVGRQETEMRLLASLSHPGLVTLFDAGKDDAGRDDGEAGEPRAFLVMELVDGPDLRKRLRDADPLSPPDVAHIGAELAGALAYIHGRGVIHRDVKPANILLPPAISGTLPRAKLTDFGIARMLDGARITATNSTLGTANYLSPEQASSKDVGFSSDIYSLGLVLLEAVTGRIEFGGSAVEAAIARLSRNPEVPDALGSYWCSLLRAMTSRDPDQRPTAAEVSAALLEYRWEMQAKPTTAPRNREEDWEADDGGEPTADVVIRTSGEAGRDPALESGPAPDSEPDRGESEPAPVERQELPASAAGGTSAPAPPPMPPRVGPAQRRSASASASLHAVPGRPTRLALAGRTLLGFVAVAVLAMAVIMVADRMGIFPQDPGYPAVPGQLGEHLRQLQESVTP